MGRNKKWTEEELILLEQLVNTMPLKNIISRINRLNRKNKTGVIRTKYGVIDRLGLLGYNAKTTEDFMCINEWGRQLMISPARIRGWTRVKDLKGFPVSNYKAIRKKDMAEFAKDYPYLFADVSLDILKYFFGDNLALEIINKRNLSSSLLLKPKQIKRLDTGITYKSIAEASRCLRLDRKTIKQEATQNGWLRFV